MCSSRTWAFERVIGFALNSKFERRRFQADSKNECVRSCLEERQFECRSVNFNRVTKECTLSDMDRQGISSNAVKSGLERRRESASSVATPQKFRDPNFGQTDDGQQVDYFENNCIEGKCEELINDVIKHIWSWSSINPLINHWNASWRNTRGILSFLINLVDQCQPFLSVT